VVSCLAVVYRQLIKMLLLVQLVVELDVLLYALCGNKMLFFSNLHLRNPC